MPIEEDDARQAARARLQARRGSNTGNESRSRDRSYRGQGDLPRRSRANDNERTGRSARRSDAESRERNRGAATGRRTASAENPGRYDSRRRDDRTARNDGSRRAAGTSGERRRTDHRTRSRNDASSRNTGRQQRQASRGSSPYADYGRTSQTRAQRQRQRSSGNQSLYARLSDMLPESIPPIFVIALIALVIFLIAVMFVMPNCSRAPEEKPVATVDQSEESTPSSTQEQATDTFTLTPSEPHQAQLIKVIGKEDATELLKRAKTDVDVLWIAAHVGEYAFDGLETQFKILTLAAEEPESIPFVRAYPSKYPLATASADGSIALPSTSPSADVPDSQFPHLYQWDERWANTSFANTAFGLSGGGPTCLAMVYQGLTGDSSKSPYDFGKIADEATIPKAGAQTVDETGAPIASTEPQTESAVEEKVGLKSAYLYECAAGLGLTCSEMYPSYDTIREALLTGQAVIVEFEAGHFTATPCYCVLTGISDDGKAIMNDPYSIERSSRLWDIDDIASAATTMFVYSKSNSG